MPLTVTDAIPYGNVADVELVMHDSEPEIRFRPHPHGGPECLWFCFRIVHEGFDMPHALFRLTLIDPQNMLGGGQPESFRPVYRMADADWIRMEQGTVQRLPDGRAEVSWTMPPVNESMDVAFCYPYGQAELEALLRDTGGYWTCDTVGVSQGGRPLLRLSNEYGDVESDRPGVYFMARQHSGETPGSWLLDGVLRFFADLGDRAPLVWAVPLANIDGVEQGDYGKDNFPYDLNRAWGQPPMRHETKVLGADLRCWKERCRPVMILDSHAPGASETNGIYAFLPNPDTFPGHHAQAMKFCEALAKVLGPDLASDDIGRVATYASRWETPNLTAFSCSTLNVCSLSFETAYSMIGDTVMTREQYQIAGARLGQALIEWIANS